MSDGPEKKSQEITKDLFGSKLELKKIYQTFIQVIKNVKVVTDDFYHNKGEYTRPVKYTISIVAPYLIIIQLFDIDMAQYIMDGSKQASDVAAMSNKNPELANFMTRYYEILARFTKIQYEFLPLVYAIVYIPILAFWLKKFFKVSEYKFSYYYALSAYLMMTTVAVTLLLFFMSINGLFSMNTYMQVSIIISFVFYTYGIISTFNVGVIKGLVKSALMLALTFITMVIPMVIIITTIAFMTMKQ